MTETSVSSPPSSARKRDRSEEKNLHELQLEALSPYRVQTVSSSKKSLLSANKTPPLIQTDSRATNVKPYQRTDNKIINESQNSLNHSLKSPSVEVIHDISVLNSIKKHSTPLSDNIVRSSSSLPSLPSLFNKRSSFNKSKSSDSSWWTFILMVLTFAFIQSLCVLTALAAYYHQNLVALIFLILTIIVAVLAL